MTEKKKPKIGVIGVGILGDTIRLYYKKAMYQVFCYDKFKKIGSIEEINKAEIIFICVPTPRGADNKCDTSIVEKAVGYIEGAGKIIVIKSTVPPFTTNGLQQIYSKHDLLFNPEFLKTRSARADFNNPTFQLVGYSYSPENMKSVAKTVLNILPPARFSRIMPAVEAELFKWVRNGWLCVKNSYANQVYEVCQKNAIDYKFIKECSEKDPWIGTEHLDVMMDGYRGFNGACLPKDSEAFLVWAEENGINLSVLRQSVEYNSALLESQNIKKDS